MEYTSFWLVKFGVRRLPPGAAILLEGQKSLVRALLIIDRQTGAAALDGEGLADLLKVAIPCGNTFRLNEVRLERMVGGKAGKLTSLQDILSKYQRGGKK